MPTSTDLSLNDRIALAKGWRHTEKPLKALWFGYLGRKSPKFAPLTYWRNPEGEPAIRPDFVGTLEGVAGLMRELGSEWDWGWDSMKRWCCWHGFDYRFADLVFFSPADCPGDCVGDAWLSVFGKENVDANTTD